MKENSCPTIGEIKGYAGVGFDELDRAVESLGTSIVHSVIAAHNVVDGTPI